MDKRLLFVLFTVLGSILVLCCCSQVFEAGISGKVVTEVGTESVAVSDVNVFAYTDKGARDSDYEEFKAGTRTRPSEKAGYVATTTTNANGEFVVNKIVWETKKSKYGKTADVNKLYLIFYHDDYDVTTEDATVISDSTNQSNVYVTLKGNKDYTTLNITVKNIATNAAMTDSCTLEYKVEGKDESDSVVVTGTTSIRISYPKGTKPDVTFTLTSPGSGWKMCDDTGDLIDSLIEEDVGSGTLAVSLYMKNYEFTLPSFSGSVEFKSGTPMMTINENPTNEQDNVSVWLEFVPSIGDSIEVSETMDAEHRTTASSVQAGNNIIYNHGGFSGVGNNGYVVTITQDNKYKEAVNWTVYEQSKVAIVKLWLVFEYDGTQKYYEFNYTFPTGSTHFDIAYTDLQDYPAP